MKRFVKLTTGAAVGLLAAAVGPTTGFAAGDAARGQKAFIQCLSCHSAKPGVHKTGPSLATIAGRKAATVDGFGRYSKALQASDFSWTDENLEAWLENPRGFVPGTSMTIPGLKKASDRRDIVAYLTKVRADQLAGQPPEKPQTQGRGMMQDQPKPDLKTLGPKRLVTGVRYCGDTYEVSTAAGGVQKVWEFNLRIKTDSSNLGPAKGKPVIIPASMMGDRAFVIFSDPQEISGFIEKRC